MNEFSSEVYNEDERAYHSRTGKLVRWLAWIVVIPLAIVIAASPVAAFFLAPLS
jgi:hypothetical protein